MKMSYQYHKAVGKPKKRWFISRDQSYHGSGSDSISLGDRPNLKFYEPFFQNLEQKSLNIMFTEKEEKMKLFWSMKTGLLKN